MKLRYHTSPKLRTMSTEVNKVTPEIRKLAKKMIKFCKEKNGLGLAAPQIGRNIRLIVLIIDGKGSAIINPKIIQRSDETETEKEYCLSCPGFEVDVERHKYITVEGTNINGKAGQTPVSNLLARCIQHEIDHLDGILIIDYEEDIS